MKINDVLQFYIGLLTKDNEKVILKQEGSRIMLDEFFLCDITMLHSVTKYTIHSKRFEHIITTTGEEFDKGR